MFLKALPEFMGSPCKSTWKQISSLKTHKTFQWEWRSRAIIYNVHFSLPFGILQTATAISWHFWVFMILQLEHFDSHNRNRVTFRKCTLCQAGKLDPPGWLMDRATQGSVDCKPGWAVLLPYTPTWTLALCLRPGLSAWQWPRDWGKNTCS